MYGVNAELCHKMTPDKQIETFQCPRIFELKKKSWCCGANSFQSHCCEWSERAKELGLAGLTILPSIRLMVGSAIILIVLVIFVWALCCYVTRESFFGACGPAGGGGGGGGDVGVGGNDNRNSGNQFRHHDRYYDDNDNNVSCYPYAPPFPPNGFDGTLDGLVSPFMNPAYVPNNSIQPPSYPNPYLPDQPPPPYREVYQISTNGINGIHNSQPLLFEQQQQQHPQQIIVREQEQEQEQQQKNEKEDDEKKIKKKKDYNNDNVGNNEKKEIKDCDPLIIGNRQVNNNTNNNNNSNNNNKTISHKQPPFNPAFN